jgi:hypothetical protein
MYVGYPTTGYLLRRLMKNKGFHILTLTKA